MSRLIATCLLALAPCAVVAQAPPPPTLQPNPTKVEKSENTQSSSSVLPGAIALILTLAILLIVCMPSRKSQT